MELPLVFIARFLASTVYFGTIPFIVYNAVNFGFGYAQGVVALIIISISSDLTKYLSGSLLAKFGAARVLTSATLTLCIAYFSAGMIGVSGGLAYLFFGIFVGICFGIFYVYYRVLFSYLGTSTSVVNYHSYMASANNLGFVIGPLIFSAMVYLNRPDRVFLCFSLLLFISALLLLFMRQKIVIEKEASSAGKKEKEEAGFSPIYIVSGLYWGVLQQVMVNFAVYSTLKFGTVVYASYFFSIQGVASALLIPAIARLVKTEDPTHLYRIIFMGIGLLCIGFVVISQVQLEWLFCLLLLLFYTASQALCISPISSIVSIQWGNDRKRVSKAFGKLGLAQGVGTIIGQLMGGIIFGQFELLHALEYYWLAVGMLGLLMAWMVYRFFVSSSQAETYNL